MLCENYVLSNYRNKKPRTDHIETDVSSVLLGLMQVKKGKFKNSRLQSVRVLLDSGSSASLVNDVFVKKLNSSSEPPSHWTTKAGTFKTEKSCLVSICFPELHKDKHVTWKMHVDSSKQLPSKYDIIIGRDLMQSIGIDLLFSTKEIRWEGTTVPMRDPSLFKNNKLERLEQEVFQLDEVEEDFIQRITEEKYSPANLPEEV